jgi:hypothetical protein
MRRRPPLLLAVVALVALVALVGLACGDDSEPAATQVGVRTAAQAGSWVECENAEEGYVLSRPADWHVGDVPVPCGAFDPESDALDRGSGDESQPAVLIEHRDVPFDRAAAGPPEGEDALSTTEQTIDGRDAVRHETRAGDASSFPAGTRVTRWTVDLRADRTMVATTTDLGDGDGDGGGDGDYGMRQEVLDGIVTSIDWVEPGTTGEGRDPVGEPDAGPTASGDYPRSGSDPASLADVRTEGHEGFDRVVVELSGAEVPSYRVAAVEPPIERDDGDGTAPVAGEAFLEIRLSPASVLDASGSRSYEGPDRIPVADGAVVIEVVRTGGTEGPLTFTVGLMSAAPFAVDVLDNPTRLVVDIVPEG